MTRSPEPAPVSLLPVATPAPETPPWESSLPLPGAVPAVCCIGFPARVDASGGPPGADRAGPGDDDDDDDDAPGGGGGGNIDPDDDEGYDDDDEDDDEEPLQCAPSAARRDFTLRRSIPC